MESFVSSVYIHELTYIRAQEGIITMKDKTVAARTDGSLQIEVHDPESGERMFWPRHYYVLPLEVEL